MRNLKAIISYDGSAYVGWERQRNGLGIQEVLEEALFQIARERVTANASGRTDAGVHAEAQVVSFELANPIHPRKLRLGLNAVLPPDIAVLELDEAPSDFHARFSAVSKLYRYRLLNHSSRHPLARQYSFHFPQALDSDAMRKAAKDLEGTHDFSSFAREADLKQSCVRTILSCDVYAREPFIDIEVRGTGFLYNMVRIITGTLIEVGIGRRAADSIPQLLEAKQRDQGGYTVPPEGLMLIAVDYDSNA